MSKHTFRITISGSQSDAAAKANALAALAALDSNTLKALAHVIKHDPQKVALAKQFLGV